MLAWIWKRRNTRPTSAARAPLVFEPLEAREVPALLGLGASANLSLGGTSVAVALYGSASLPSTDAHTLGLTAGAQVSLALFQAPAPAPAAPAPAPTPAPSAPAGTASVAGAVRYSQFGGDEVGPVAGATVTLTDDAGNVVASATTDASGNYSLTALPAGPYTLSVSSDEFGTASQALTLADGQAATQNFTLST